MEQEIKKEKSEKSIFKIICYVLIVVFAIAIIGELFYIIHLKEKLKQKNEDIDDIPNVEVCSMVKEHNLEYEILCYDRVEIIENF